MASEWYVRTKAGEQGPYSAGKLKALAAAGRIRATTPIRRDDADQFVPAGKLKGLFPDEVEGAADAAAPERPAAHEAARPSGSRRSGRRGGGKRAPRSAGSAGGRWQPVVTLGWIVVSSLVVFAVCDAHQALRMQAQLDYLEGVAETGGYVEAEALEVDDAARLATLVTLGALFVTGLLFIIWFHRSYRNLGALGARRARGTGWAIGAWFVPFLNLWWPFQMAAEIQRRVDAPAKALLIAWWIAWVMPATVGNVAEVVWGSEAAVPGLQGQALLAAMANDHTIAMGTIGMRMLAAVLAIVVVVHMSKAQQACASEAAL